jgi:hypothetical protein
MKMKIKPNKQALEIFETPWLRYHVEGHLFFGPLAKNFPFGWILFAIFTVYYIGAIVTTEKSLLLIFVANLDILFFILVSMYLLILPKYVQAAIGWCVTKFVGGLIAFIFLIAGGLVGFIRGQPDAIYITLIAIVCFPSIEFIPKLTKQQKYITLSRLFISIPIVFLWYSTGTWH